MSNLNSQTVLSVHHWTDTLFSFTCTRDSSFRFENGQFTMVGLEVEGKPLLRAYSLASANYEEHLEFLSIKVPDGPLTSRLQHLKVGDSVLIGKKPTGTLVADNLLPGKTLWLLSTGTGLAPFLSMLEVLARANSQQKIHLIYGVTRDLDLVQVEAIEAYTAKLSNFTFSTVVADADSDHPRKGWVTQHMPAESLNDGDVDVYLCGPPPMVDAVRKHFDDNGVKPNSFHYEKFTPNAAPVTA